MEDIELIKLALVMTLILFLSLLPITHANSNGSEVKSRTFMDCYSMYSQGFLLASMFTPSTIDLNDPKAKQLISNMCNFYYEKTGEWMYYGYDLKPEYVEEFFQKYNNTIPESFIELSKNLKGISNFTSEP